MKNIRLFLAVVANEEQANIEILIFYWNGKPAGQ